MQQRLFLSLSHVAAKLRAMSWPDLGAYAFAAFSCSAIAMLLAPASMKPFIRGAGFAIVLILLAAKDLAHAPDAWQRLRAARAARKPWHAHLTALLPPGLPGFAKLDRLMWTGCLRRLRRQAPAPRPDGVALTYLERGAYGAAAAGVLVSVLLELPVHAMLVNLFVKDAGRLAIVHAAGAASAVYALVWVLGDRWHVGAGRHVLTEDALDLQVGARTSGVLPLAAIEGYEAVNDTLRVWRRRRGVGSAETTLVSPFDKPNCVLVLKADAQVEILHHQVRRQAPRYVFLYLDRPELLAARLRQR
ncbi:hypothetical protein [Massilia niastensis]|uniref:hypothetical protein n=1 Tax=Massilia niastensis TaxID=544911 RepID=UPI0003772FA9|nr:hypothetical protein [Massilia niastensis]